MWDEIIDVLHFNFHLMARTIRSRLRMKRGGIPGLLSFGGGLEQRNGIPLDAIEPGVTERGDVIAAEGLPNGAVALDAGAERDLPDGVALADAVLGLHVRELVPDRAGGGVAESVERHPRGLHVVLR